MKNSMLLAVMAVLFLTACNKEKSTTAQAKNETPEVITESELDIAANETDLDFQVAIAAFRKNDFSTAAHYVEQAMADLKKEADLDVKGTKLLKQTLADLQSLADKVRNGDVHDEIELQEYYAYVDMLTAHDYLVLAESYAVDAPQKSEGAMKKAADWVERASQKTENEAKAEMVTLHKAIKSDIASADKKTLAIGDAAGARVLEMKHWLGRQAHKLGLHLPKQDPDE